MNDMKTEEIDSEKAITCPYCGALVIPDDSDEENTLMACPHTVIIATDEGLEYARDHVDIEALEQYLEDEDLGWDEGLAEMKNTGDHLRRRYQSAPSFFGVYVLFSEKPGEALK